MSQSEEEKNIIRSRYRFQGYQLPKLQLDETGPSYYDVNPHPYFYNQPAFWTAAYIEGDPYGGPDWGDSDTPTTADTDPVIAHQYDSSTSNTTSRAPKAVKAVKAPKAVKAVNNPSSNESKSVKSKNGQLYSFLPPLK